MLRKIQAFWFKVFTKKNPNLQKKDEVETLPMKVLDDTAKGSKNKVKPNSPQVRNTTNAQEQLLATMLKVKVPVNSSEFVVESATDTIESIGQLKPKNRKRDTTSDDILNQVAKCTVNDSIVDTSNIQVDSKDMSKKSRDNDQPLTSKKLHRGDTTVCILGAGIGSVPILKDNDNDRKSNTFNYWQCTNNEFIIPHATIPNADEKMKSVNGDSPKCKKKRKAKLRNECSTSSSAEDGNTLSLSLAYPEDLENADLHSSPTASIWDMDKSVVKTTPTDSPQSGDSPRDKKGKTKWTKLNLEFPIQRHFEGPVIEGEVYEAVVLDTRSNSFVVLVGQDTRVVVFRQRFKPWGGKTPDNVPITCVLKIGDRVKLTAIRKTGNSKCKDGEEWVAVECWQEGPVSTRGLDHETLLSSVAELDTRAVKLADGTYVFAEVLFLFGFHLAHSNVNLMNIFQLGDELMYTLPFDALKRSGPYKAEKAWFGSLPTDGDDKPSNEQQFELIKFFKARPRDVSMSVITAVCGLNKNAVGVKDDFDDIYRDIFSAEDQLLPTMSADFRNNKSLPKAGIKNQHSMDITSSTAGVHRKKQVELAKLKNKTQQKTASSRNELIASASMTTETTSEIKLVNVATQTCATGDLVCFYAMYHSDTE